MATKTATRSINDGGEDQRFGRVYNPTVVVRFFPYLKSQKWLMAAASMSMILFTASQVAVPWLIKVGIDDYITVGDFTGLTLVVAIFLGNAILNWGASYAQDVNL